MTNYVKIKDVSSTTWRAINAYYAKVGNVWQTVSKGYTKISGTWRQFYSRSTMTATAKSYAAGSVTLTWSSVTSASTYRVSYNSTYTDFSGLTGTITGLSTSASTTFTITARSSGGATLDSVTISYTANGADASPPSQTSAPYFTGRPATIAAFSSLTSNSGSYTNYISSIVTKIIVTTSSSFLTSGTTTRATGIAEKSGSTYIVTQFDALTPAFKFYVEDTVTGIDGLSYYFYSDVCQSYTPTFIDDYTRTVSYGLGYMTPIKNSGTTPSSFSYNSYSINPGDWIVNGSQAVSSTAVTAGSTTSSNYSMESVEVGYTDVSLQINIPDGGGGMGVAFWVTSANSWWASTAEYNTSTSSTSTCTGGPISTTSSGGGSCCDSPTAGTATCTGTKHSSTGTPSCTGGCSAYADGVTCAGSQTLNYCPNASLTPTVGGRCSSCSTSTFYTCTNQSSTGQSTPPATVTCTAAGQTCGYTVSLVGGVFVYYPTRCVSNTQYSYSTYVQQYSCNDAVTPYTCHTSVTSTVTNYNTNIVIYSSVSGTVSSSITNINSSTSSFKYAKNLVVIASSGTISVSAYDAVNGTNKIGSTVVSTPISPTKSLTNGESSVGVFKGGNRDAGSTGSILDDFYYVRL